MNRKQFIESHGATCRNWTWSWSFVNHAKRFVIFGAWDTSDEGDKVLILSEDWAISRKGKRQASYRQSREHIRLIEEQGYQLKTFPMEHASADESDQTAPARIRRFTPRLTDRALGRVGTSWYAMTDDGARLPEELDPRDAFIKGSSRTVVVNAYERNAAARARCVEHHGYTCSVCSFDFAKRYGAVGRHYIHVHHVVPPADMKGEYQLDPITDLVPICPNCHAMIHTTRPPMSLSQLRRRLTL
jgi:5-methylcytosine-specific restriction protein A